MEHSLNTSDLGNARELGGFLVGDKKIRHGCLLRTASLSNLTSEDKRVLTEDYRLSCIVDLRMKDERHNQPDPDIHNVKNHFLPVMELQDFPSLGEEFVRIISDPTADRIKLMHMAYDTGYFNNDFYVRLILSERGKNAFRGFFECLLNLPEDHSILWHCTDGKDRTGLASMLILTALGADRKTIMEDYLLTNLYNKEKLDKARAGLAKMSVSDDFREVALFGCGAVYEYYMLNALKALDENYGSPSEYLKEELGIGKSECNELQKKFLE